MLNTAIERGVLKSLIFIQQVKSVSLGVICHSDFSITKEKIPNYICQLSVLSNSLSELNKYSFYSKNRYLFPNKFFPDLQLMLLEQLLSSKTFFHFEVLFQSVSLELSHFLLRSSLVSEQALCTAAQSSPADVPYFIYCLTKSLSFCLALLSLQ